MNLLAFSLPETIVVLFMLSSKISYRKEYQKIYCRLSSVLVEQIWWFQSIPPPPRAVEFFSTISCTLTLCIAFLICKLRSYLYPPPSQILMSMIALFHFPAFFSISFHVFFEVFDPLGLAFGVLWKEKQTDLGWKLWEWPGMAVFYHLSPGMVQKHTTWWMRTGRGGWPGNLVTIIIDSLLCSSCKGV